MTLTADDNTQLLNKNNFYLYHLHNYIYIYHDNYYNLKKIMIGSNQATHNKMYLMRRELTDLYNCTIYTCSWPVAQ